MDDVIFNSNASLRPLSGLSDLRSCVLSRFAVSLEWDIGHTSALFTLSRLTRLQLHLNSCVFEQNFYDGLLGRLCAALPSLGALALPDMYPLSDAVV